jgi:hypothetical protein
MRARRGLLPVRWAQAHFWLSVVVGLQVVAWIATGAFFALNPIDQGRSAHLLQDHTPAAIKWRSVAMTPEQAPGRSHLSVSERRLAVVAGRPLYLETSAEGPQGWVDAETGAAGAVIPEEWARRVALSTGAGEEGLAALELLEQASQEDGADRAVWAARFDAPGSPVVDIEAAIRGGSRGPHRPVAPV